MADPASGIGVGDVHELADCALAVTGDAGGDASRDGCQFPANHEAPVVVAGDVCLDDDVARPALLQGVGKGGPNGLLGAQVEMHSTAMIAVERLEDARVSEAPRRGD